MNYPKSILRLPDEHLKGVMNNPTSILKSVVDRPLIKRVQCTVEENKEGEKSGQCVKHLLLRSERRGDGYCVQISDEKDLRFVYSDQVTPQKFKDYAARWNLSNLDMEEYFQDRLATIVEEASLKCFLSSTREHCNLILEMSSEMFKNKMDFDLNIVAGEDLIEHLLLTVRKKDNSLRKYATQLKELEALQRESKSLKEMEWQLKDSNEQLQGQLTDTENRLLSAERQLRDTRNDLDLEKGVREEWEEKYEKLMDDYDEAVEDLDKAMMVHAAYTELEGENEMLRNKVKRLEQENRQLTEDLEQSEHIIRKYHLKKTPEISVSSTKVKELEDACKEKDELIDRLNKQNQELKQEHGKMAKTLQVSEQARKSAQEEAGILKKMVKSSMSSPQLLPPQIGLPSASRSHFQLYNSPQIGLSRTPAMTGSPIYRGAPGLSSPSIPLSSSYSAMPVTPALDKFNATNGIRPASALFGRASPAPPSTNPGSLPNAPHSNLENMAPRTRPAS